MKNKGAKYISVLSSLVLILIWYIASLILGAEVILPSPISVFKSFIELFSQKMFFQNIVVTVLRALESFVIIVVSGAVIGILAGRSSNLRNAVSPLVTVFKATPVMSVVLIAFIWFRTGAVPVFSAFLMGFPVMFVQTVRGYKAMDPKLNQMCTIYKITGRERLEHYIIPSLIPSLVTGAKQTLSMIWKVVIAAEVITLPKYGIGRALQLSQIQLETSRVFAWTIIAIILTALGDHLFDLLMKRITGGRPGYDN